MRWCGWVVVTLAGCTVAPVDLYPEAVRSVREGRLLRALALLEQVPAAHPRRQECDRLWQEVDQRIRLAHVQIAEAFCQQAGGDSAVAHDLLAAVQADWPEAPGLGEAAAQLAWSPVLPTPTAAMAASVADAVPAPPGPELAPAMDATDVPTALVLPELPPAVSAPPAVVFGDDQVVTPPTPAGFDVSAGHVAGGRSGEVTAATPEPGEGQPDLDLLRSLVHGNDIRAAIEQLDVEQRRHPAHQEVAELLVGLLRRRALAAYGRGWLDTAAEDWTRIAQLMPGDLDAHRNLKTVRAEIAQRQAPRERR